MTSLYGPPGRKERKDGGEGRREEGRMKDGEEEVGEGGEGGQH